MGGDVQYFRYHPNKRFVRDELVMGSLVEFRGLLKEIGLGALAHRHCL